MSDPVDHPAHYTSGPIECIDAIRAAVGSDGFKAYLRGNIMKYVWRAGRKDDAVQDLKKARWYIDRLITEETNAKG